ncbi:MULTISPECIES: GDP-L-fucose synthase [unclassified Chelatococcus]|uniref:GDP-L-fucose synthase family protein n=1 Tax=unclassified Chelatococcus TaxID=2638111 RepID=UPI001BCF49B3|nr:MULTISPECIES: GDP-L-fucose synthase [unclassified Chelatococcus]MBS7695938.1 GDP-L-fucose synthase [Chelatococcus sp. YT9]MBX3555687.1 GDP-L-fucose synthase [Chelatococcus sp.]
MALSGRRIFVAGHRGMVGSALTRRLAREDCKLLTIDRTDLDLTRQADVEAWMLKRRPDIVLVAAARVGGIVANATFPAEFLYDNLMIGANVISAARRAGVTKLLYLGSSCIYPKLATQPIEEAALLTGALEPTNEAYAVAKIAGLKLAEAYAREHGCRFITAMPTNLYGPNDNFDLTSSHVIPALMRKIHEAKEAGKRVVDIWGSGTPRREFLHVDDLADACIFLLKAYEAPEPINVGSGMEVTIRQLAEAIAEVIGYAGEFAFDTSKPDGAPRKLLDTTRLRDLGWTPRIGLRAGLADAYGHWRAREEALAFSLPPLSAGAAQAAAR